MTDVPENRILIVAPSWIGDMIMAQSLYKHLRHKSPDVEIDVLAPSATITLVSRMPEVSNGIAFKLGHGDVNLSYRKGLGEQLRSRHYRQAYILPNSFKSAFVPFFADIPIRTGFRGEYRYVLINDMRLQSKSRLPRMVDQFVALGMPEGVSLPEIEYPELIVDEDNLKECLARLTLDCDQPVLGLCPGAEFGDAKKWPEAHFAKVARQALAAGMQVWLFGGPSDVETGERILEMVPANESSRIRNLAGATSIGDAIDLISRCHTVVSNDSGLMHIAAALGRRLVVLYGSTSPGFTPPLGADAIVLSEELSCSPCFKRVCPLGHKNCLNGLLPERVLDVIDVKSIAE